MTHIHGISGDFADILEATVGIQEEVIGSLNEWAFQKYWKPSENLLYLLLVMMNSSLK